jgi:hypothetical protein
MAINSGIPPQNGLNVSNVIFTSKLSGTPGPASEAGQSSLLVVTPGGASTGQQAALSTESLSSAGVTAAPEGLVGEIHGASYQANGSVEAEPIPLATASSGSPTAGAPPTPAPTVVGFTTAEASNGQQPNVTTPFSNAGWNTISSV